MREIKFRAWDREAEYFRYWEYGGTTPYVHPAIEPPQQFTGLKDKNGKEIYEGDIVKEAKDEQVWVVEWREAAWWFVNPHDNTNLWTHDWLVNEQGEKWRQEVIGNIYENPDLLTPTIT